MLCLRLNWQVRLRCCWQPKMKLLNEDPRLKNHFCNHKLRVIKQYLVCGEMKSFYSNFCLLLLAQLAVYIWILYEATFHLIKLPQGLNTHRGPTLNWFCLFICSPRSFYRVFTIYFMTCWRLYSICSLPTMPYSIIALQTVNPQHTIN